MYNERFEICDQFWMLHYAIFVINLPVIVCLRNGKLLREVTLLLSIDKSTGIGAVVPSECDRS